MQPFQQIRCLPALFLFLCAHAANALTVTTLYTFGPPPDGGYPESPLAVGKDGVLYGTTYQGGAYGYGPGYNGYGTVFSLKPPQSPGGPWTETILWNFGGTTSDGRIPTGRVLIGPGGVLYGITVGGGTYGDGTVFALTPPANEGGAWSETILYTFDGSSGQGPIGNLVTDSHGVLYGTTLSGGPYGTPCPVLSGPCGGTVFSLTPPTTTGGAWIGTTLWNFGGFPGDGLAPNSLIMSSSGVLYGTTESGGAYYTPPGGCPGVTIGGQYQKCEGTIFALTPPAVQGGPWTETQLWSFGGPASIGSWPNGVIMGGGGVLYGTTQYGSKPAVFGSIFSLTPPSAAGGLWTEQDLHGFLIRTEPVWEGFTPYGNLLLAQDGALYGTTFGGGTSDEGTIFVLKPTASSGAQRSLATIWSFSNGSGGQYPSAGLVRGTGGVLYGTTSGSYGVGSSGAVFSLVP